MRHVFLATILGWEKKLEWVWFDSKLYTMESAAAQFKPYNGTTEMGYPYIGYIFGGTKYHDVTYFGEFEDDKMPK